MLATWLGNRSDLSLLILRLVLGSTFIYHGWGKLYTRGLGPMGEMFGNMGLYPGIFWAVVVAFSEFFGGLCVLLGLFSRWGAFFIACVMAVAIALVHLPKGDNVEWQLALLAISLAVIFAGGGRFGLGWYLRRSARETGETSTSSF